MLQRAASNAYSWWMASHIRTKQSKWMEQNLQDMEEKVSAILKLIEEDGDSFMFKTNSPISPTLLMEKKSVPAMTSASPSRGFEPPICAKKQVVYRGKLELSGALSKECLPPTPNFY
ncbi:hypothetical protein HRI_002771100 [Hibiscus trionum]|uniref:NAB domain-containing protein n=1 Tax=Hibiscus trionum TaxID=183268 RepID=A0A9W7I8S2_HIBTR|nr:hypothetical protein HRI_002771100 [Hibiscus trionum]